MTKILPDELSTQLLCYTNNTSANVKLCDQYDQLYIKHFPKHLS
jgi:hypothetical protein